MKERTRLRGGPFVIAVAVATAIVLSAPLIGQIRGWIRATFPGRFVLVVGVIGGVLLAGALVAAATRIRERRAARFGAVAAALAIGVIYSALNASDNAESNAVERFHFLEYGLLTWLFYRAWRPLGDGAILVLPMLAGIIVGTAEEWLQWFIPNRVGELRDIFLNLAAIVCGLVFSLGVDPPARFVAALGPSSWARVMRLAAVTVLALAAFFHSVHLGYTLVDPDIGSFTSRYAPERLPALQAEKAERWKTSPPPIVLQRISREDQYLSEGLAHVRWRNKQWDAGDINAAWNENRILEKYFSPVLDTPTYEGKQGHRWPAEQRADAEARLAGAPAASLYVSQAYPYRIYTWRRTTFWTIVTVIAAVLVVTGSGRGRRAPA
jgi:VanZ family protein